MLERQRPIPEDFSSFSGGPDDPFAVQSGPGLATVSAGVHMERLPVSGMAVGEIRRRFSDRLDIDPQSVALIDGRSADDRTIVQTGQVLMFVRQAGEKGRCPS
jgi:hypothetical protein